MPILTLVNRLTAQEPETQHPIHDSEQPIRESFLYGLALLAQVDRRLTDHEASLFEAIAEGLKIPSAEARKILTMATQPTMEEGQRMIERLRHSKLKIHLILDMRIMAHQDGTVCAAEEHLMRQMANLLQIDERDYHDLVELADAVFDGSEKVRQRWDEKFKDRSPHSGLDSKNLSHYIR